MSEITEILNDAEVVGTPVRENGRMTCQVRCRIPVQLDIGRDLTVRKVSTQPEIKDDSTSERAEEKEYSIAENEQLIVGVASSTSVDWHGTEMSLQALQRMVAQFKVGVSHVPSHRDDEWDQMIGRTVDADIEQREVVNPAPGMREVGEPQYIVKVTSVVYTDTEKGKMLVNRLSRGDVIGWSIGGWFTDMRVIYDEDDDKIERIIIEHVDLDHLAVTRKPSNPDSFLEGMRGKAMDAVSAYRAKDVRAKDAGLDGEKKSTRSIVPFKNLAIDYDREWNWDTTARDEILGDSGDNWKRYRDAHIYYDSDKPEDNKGAYKLPIARMVDDDLMAIWDGVVAAMGAVNGARGGVNIGDDERRKAYDHLIRYYKKADRDPPAFRSERAEPVFEDPPGSDERPGEQDDAPVSPLGGDEFKDEQSAKIRGEALGCGLFSHETSGGTFMPCQSAEKYQEALYSENTHPEGETLMETVSVEGGDELSKVDPAETIEPDFEDINTDVDNTQGIKTLSIGDSLMSTDVERAESASISPDEAAVSALNEKVDALTRSVEAIVGQMQARTQEPEPEPVVEPVVVEAPKDDRIDAIARSMETLTELMAKRAADAEVAPEPAEDPEKVDLRARLADMEHKVARMAAKPLRRAVRFSQEIRTADTHPDASLLQSVDERQAGASALSAVARDFEGVVYYNKRIHGKDARPSRDDLKEALRAVYMAASVDGVISNPDFN